MIKLGTYIKKMFATIPGSAMSVPLVLAMITNTFFPTVFKIGNLSTALFQDGALTLLGLLFFFVGTQFQFCEIKKMWREGILLLFYKLSVGSLGAITFSYFFGFEGILGVTPLVLLIALTQPNLAMYVAITQKFGRSSQLSLLPLFMFMEIPLITLLVLGMNGMIWLSFTDYLAMVIPFLLGFFIGYIFNEKRQHFSVLISVVIPFFAFSAGSHFTLNDILQSGLSGMILSLIVLGSGIVGFLILRLVSSNHATSGTALGSTAGTSLVIPPLLAALDQRYIPMLPSIAAQLVTVTVLTCILCPLAAKYLQRYERLSPLNMP